MKKLIFILAITFSLISCEKEDLNQFQNTYWIGTESSIEFYEYAVYINSRIPGAEMSGTFTVENNVASLAFSKGVIANHSAQIISGALILTNLSSNTSSRYERKSNHR